MCCSLMRYGWVGGGRRVRPREGPGRAAAPGPGVGRELGRPAAAAEGDDGFAGVAGGRRGRRRPLGRGTGPGGRPCSTRPRCRRPCRSARSCVGPRGSPSSSRGWGLGGRRAATRASISSGRSGGGRPGRRARGAPGWPSGDGLGRDVQPAAPRSQPDGCRVTSFRAGGDGAGRGLVLDGGDGGGWVEGAAGAPAQRAAAVGRALVLEPSLPAAGGRVLQPGQLEGQPGGEGDLDQPTGPTPAGVAVLADAADEVVGPAPVVAGVLAPAPVAPKGPVGAGGRVAEAQQVHPAHRARLDPRLAGDPGPQRRRPGPGSAAGGAGGGRRCGRPRPGPPA